MITDQEKIFSRSKLLPWFIFVLLFGLLLQLLFLNAPLESDDTSYLSFADHLSIDGLRSPNNLLSLRTGILLPGWLVIKAFGYNIASYYILSIGFAILLVAGIFLLTERIAGLLPAVIACLLYSSSAFGLYQTSNFLPDVPNLFCLLISFYFFSIALGKSGRAACLPMLLASFFAFYAYLIRMPNSVFLIAIPVYEFLSRKTIKKSLIFFALFGGLWVLECCFYLVIAGDFLLRLHHVPKGLNLSEINQHTVPWHLPSLSLTDYLVGPWRNLLRFNSGLVLLPAGLLGILLALKKKNYAMVSIFIGALTLFLSYSYAVNSISPLVRSLPLQVRYIICFTVVLTISTAFLLKNGYDLVVKRIGAGTALVFLALLCISIQGFSLKNYSSELTYRFFYNRDFYFKADRMLGEFLERNDFDEVVHTFPYKDFVLYPNCSRLKLEPLQLVSTPMGNTWFLISRPAIRETLYWARAKNNAREVQTAEFLLQDNNPKWRYVINTDEIMLAYIPSFEFESRKVLDLIERWGDGIWTWNRDLVNVQLSKDGITVSGDMRKQQYVYTFHGGFDSTPHGFEKIFSLLKPGEPYILQLEYEVREPVSSLLVFWSEYDNRERIKSQLEKLPFSMGEHSYRKIVNLTNDYQAFRVFLRFTKPDSKGDGAVMIKEAAIYRME